MLIEVPLSPRGKRESKIRLRSDSRVGCGDLVVNWHITTVLSGFPEWRLSILAHQIFVLYCN